MAQVDLPPQFQNLPELQSDSERVERMEALRAALEAGTITTHLQVEAVLKSFGAHVGPMGCTSTELEIAKAQLDRVREAKGHKISFV